MMMKLCLGMMAVCALLFTSGAAYANLNDKPPKAKGSFKFTKDFSDAKVYGSGSYRYRMVLLDPINHQPIANQDYALDHNKTDLPFVKESKKVFQGKTDAQGRTAVFAFKQKVDPAGWNLRPRTGSGPLGEQMVITDSKDAPHVGLQYVLLVCEDDPYIYRGITDVSGQTAYVATQTPANIHVYMDTGNIIDDTDCSKQ